MLNKFTYSLLFATSFFIASISPSAIAADMKMAPKAAQIKTIEKININKATVSELSKIKGIGTKKAQAIIDYRTENGMFTDLKQITKVKGIGNKMLAKVQPFILLE